MRCPCLLSPKCMRSTLPKSGYLSVSPPAPPHFASSSCDTPPAIVDQCSYFFHVSMDRQATNTPCFALFPSFPIEFSVPQTILFTCLRCPFYAPSPTCTKKCPRPNPTPPSTTANHAHDHLRRTLTPILTTFGCYSPSPSRSAPTAHHGAQFQTLFADSSLFKTPLLFDIRVPFPSLAFSH